MTKLIAKNPEMGGSLVFLWTYRHVGYLAIRAPARRIPYCGVAMGSINSLLSSPNVELLPFFP